MRAHFGVIVVLLLAVGLPATAASAPATDTDEVALGDRLYTDAQRELEGGTPARALPLLEEYLDAGRSPTRPEHTFWAIDRVVYVLLGVKRDPDATLAFFERIRSDARLTDIDRGAIDEGIAVASDWRAERAQTGSGLRDAATLFERGKRYFNSGLDKTQTGIPSLASAQFDLASGYLGRFAILHPRHPRIGEVLYMLGAIRFHSRADESAWSDNFYLKESIRRFPHTELANRSFDMLRREAGRAYTAPSIPPELAENLRLYQDLARLLAPPA